MSCRRELRITDALDHKTGLGEREPDVLEIQHHRSRPQAGETSVEGDDRIAGSTLHESVKCQRLYVGPNDRTAYEEHVDVTMCGESGFQRIFAHSDTGVVVVSSCWQPALERRETKKPLGTSKEQRGGGAPYRPARAPARLRTGSR
jgi:hypothetical protein